jgi:hypothetical protein
LIGWGIAGTTFATTLSILDGAGDWGRGGGSVSIGRGSVLEERSFKQAEVAMKRTAEGEGSVPGIAG